MFESRRQSTPLFGGLVYGLICTAIGYGVAHYQHTRTPYRVSSTDTGLVVISYNKQNPRPIFYEQNKIKVGSVRERLEDLLDESPGTIEGTTVQILRAGR